MATHNEKSTDNENKTHYAKMQPAKSRKISLRAISIAFIVCAVIALILPIIIIYIQGLDLKAIHNNTVVISEAEGFVDALVQNSKMGKLYGANKTYTLDKNITLSKDDVAKLQDQSVAFYGVLDGQNCIVSFAPDAIIEKPLIKTLAGGDVGGEIKRITFDGVNLYSKAGQTVALIGYNNGSIEDVRLIGAKLTINSTSVQENCAVAALVAYNTGAVNRCVVDAQAEFEPDSKNDVRLNHNNLYAWQCTVASTIGVNSREGSVKDVIAEMKYSDDLAILSAKAAGSNNYVGYIIGGLADGAEPSGIQRFQSDEITAPAYCGTVVDRGLISSVTYQDLRSNYNRSEYANKWKNWILPDESMPILKPGSTYDMSAVIFEDKIVYHLDGQSHSLAVGGVLPEGVTVTYKYGNDVQSDPFEFTETGTYKITAEFHGDATRYGEIKSMQATLSIIEHHYDLSKIWFLDAEFTYDGEMHSIYILGNLPEGVTVTYNNNGHLVDGEYEVTAIFSDDIGGVFAKMTATMKILRSVSGGGSYDVGGGRGAPSVGDNNN